MTYGYNVNKYEIVAMIHVKILHLNQQYAFLGKNMTLKFFQLFFNKHVDSF